MCASASETVEQHAAVDEKLAKAHSCHAVWIMLLCGFGWVSDGAEGVVLSYMLPTLEDAWHLSHAKLGIMPTSISAGQALGSVFWGALADVIGRRKVFLLSLAFTVVFGLASSFSPGFYSYCALRLATGFAIGGNLPLAVSVASELLPPDLRERGVVALQLFNEVGSLASTGLAAALLPDHWRTYLVIVSLPAAAVFLAAVFRLPESPHWLVSRHRHDEAEELLERLASGGSGVSPMCWVAPASASLASADEAAALATRHSRPSVDVAAGSSTVLPLQADEVAVGGLYAVSRICQVCSAIPKISHPFPRSPILGMRQGYCTWQSHMRQE